MTATNYVYLIALVLAFMATGTWVLAEGDVTVVPTSSSTPAPAQKTDDSDGGPVVHKSLHKKKKTETAAATTPATTVAATTNMATAKTPVAPAPVSHAQASVTVGPGPVTPAPTTATNSPVTASHPHPNVVVGPPPITPMKPPPAIAPTNIAVVKGVPIAAPPPVLVPAIPGTTAPSPLIETGLPVAHYPGVGSPIKGVSTYVAPTPIVIPSAKPLGTAAPASTNATTHQHYFANSMPASVYSVAPLAAGSFSTPPKPKPPSDNFEFTSVTKKTKLNYPWKTGIITTKFWIGESGSSISSTDNVGSAWDEHWRATNRGNDTPNDRNGYAPSDHAATVNTFYVALPFNDLAFPDKARQWVPRSWRRSPQDGKQVSACKDRWVWIKNANGRSCFAQWEDVGPLRYDHAEYVFGSDRPDTYTRAGLDVSPAVADYLGMDNDRKTITSWRFVDEEDVPPGQWLKYEEQAVLFRAIHALKNAPMPSAVPIQRASEPVQDPDSLNSNKKKVGASKG